MTALALFAAALIALALGKRLDDRATDRLHAEPIRVRARD